MFDQDCSYVHQYYIIMYHYYLLYICPEQNINYVIDN